MARILVADDDLVQLDLRRELLESAGHEVALAFSPHETLHQLERGEPDVVLLDLRFPNQAGEPDAREGLELIQRIRKHSARVRVMVLSGWPDELVGQPEESMVSLVMVKPVRSEELLEAIAALAGAFGPGQNPPSVS